MPDMHSRTPGLAEPPRSQLLASARNGVDALAFSSLLPAAAAAALLGAAAAALNVPTPWTSLGIATAGTLVVYNVDRLRDVARDRVTAPLRSSFVERHRRRLQLLTLAAAVVCAACAAGLPQTARVLCGALFAAGLLHRRLKRHELLKRVYVTAAWVAVTAGLPSLAAFSPSSPSSLRGVGWLIAVYTAAIASNVLASSLRGSDRAAVPAESLLMLARTIAALGALLAVFAPPGIRPLVWVPLAQLAGLAAFQPSERYGLVVIDGALALGALVSLASRSLA